MNFGSTEPSTHAVSRGGKKSAQEQRRRREGRYRAYRLLGEARLFPQGSGVQPRRRFPGLDQVKQDLAHLLRLGDHRGDTHRGTTAAIRQGIRLVDLGDQPGPCSAGLSGAKLRFRRTADRRGRCEPLLVPRDPASTPRGPGAPGAVCAATYRGSGKSTVRSGGSIGGEGRAGAAAVRR